MRHKPLIPPATKIPLDINADRNLCQKVNQLVRQAPIIWIPSHLANATKSATEQTVLWPVRLENIMLDREQVGAARRLSCLLTHQKATPKKPLAISLRAIVKPNAAIDESV